MSREQKLKTGRLGAAVFLILLVAFPPLAPAWKEQMHKLQLTPQALDLISLKDSRKYPEEIWKTFKVYIEQGSFDEDFPCCEYIRANNHYRHALSGRRLSDTPFVTMGDPDVDTLTWAKRNASLSPWEEFHDGDQWAGMKLGGWTASDVRDGNMSWEEAINRYGYTESSKRLAYYTLGFLLHLLQDMGCPEHVHDDPHGASGFNGFEMWVFNNYSTGDKLAPLNKFLTPRGFKELDDYFINLSKLGYSVDRFHGGSLSVRPPCVEAGSDFSKMFKVNYSMLESEWRLENPNGKAICTGDFAWDKDDYERDPNWTKGHDNGEWWPTSVEIVGAAFESANDKPGFYYIELSGDAPYRIDRQRNLYPDAFLPTPLPEVEDQCRGWRQEKTRGIHLYSLIGKAIFPHVIEHSAGLVEHYFDIVNHPPYVQSVEVAQGKLLKYQSFFEDREDIKPFSDTVRIVKERNLKTTAASPLETGDYRVTVTFSEPVRDVRVRVGSHAIAGTLDASEAVWSGNLSIRSDGFAAGEYTLSISASDQNNHYGGQGGLLDSRPQTPARRVCKSEKYEWNLYEPGEDQNHRIRVGEAVKKAERAPATSAPPVLGQPGLQPITFQGQIFYDSDKEYRSQPGQATIIVDRDRKVRGSFQISFDVQLLKPGTGTPYQKHSGSISGSFTGEAKLNPATHVLSIEAKGLNAARYSESRENLDPWFKRDDKQFSGQADVHVSGDYSTEKRQGQFHIGIIKGSVDSANIEITYSHDFYLRINR
jgi:hypothetical protein